MISITLLFEQVSKAKVIYLTSMNSHKLLTRIRVLFPHHVSHHANKVQVRLIFPQVMLVRSWEK
jgi:hypothetical protein